MTISLGVVKNEIGDNTFVANGEDTDFQCWKCFKPLVVGYMCENNKNIILCKTCQDSCKMRDCKHDKWGEHKHIKFTKVGE